VDAILEEAPGGAGGDVKMASRLTSGEFEALMRLMMCADPYPVEDDSIGQEELSTLLAEEAQARGWDSWITAYHQMP
jgi:hypothetical protein